MTLTDWSADDLAANRAGKLSDAQVSRIRGRMFALIALWLAITAGIIVVVNELMLSRGGGARVGGYATIAMILIVMLPLVVIRYTDLAPDLASRTVTPISGEVKVDIRSDGRVSFRTVKKWRGFSVGGTDVRPMYSGLETMNGKTATVFVMPKSSFAIAMQT